MMGMEKEEFTARLYQMQKRRKMRERIGCEKLRENDYNAYHMERVLSTKRRYKKK